MKALTIADKTPMRTLSRLGMKKSGIPLQHYAATARLLPA